MRVCKKMQWKQKSSQVLPSLHLHPAIDFTCHHNDGRYNPAFDLPESCVWLDLPAVAGKSRRVHVPPPRTPASTCLYSCSHAQDSCASWSAQGNRREKERSSPAAYTPSRSLFLSPLVHFPGAFLAKHPIPISSTIPTTYPPLVQNHSFGEGKCFVFFLGKDWRESTN